jgi:hypothetical protein
MISTKIKRDDTRTNRQTDRQKARGQNVVYPMIESRGCRATEREERERKRKKGETEKGEREKVEREINKTE